MDNIQGPNYKKKKQGNVNSSEDVTTITLNHLGEKIDIDPKEIKEACAQAAKNAYNLGETNDEETYKKDMEEIIEEVLKEKAKRSTRG
jgi:hypothetical protein